MADLCSCNSLIRMFLTQKKKEGKRNERKDGLGVVCVCREEKEEEEEEEGRRTWR